MENYDIRIMSVKNQTFHQLASQFLRFKNDIHADICDFRSYLLQFQILFMQTLTISTQPSRIKQATSSVCQASPREQMQSLVLQNEELKKQLLQAQDSYNDMKSANDILIRENKQKEEKVKQLVAQVEQIKLYMKQLREMSKNDEIVDFDEEGSEETKIKTDGLQTIKEVSEYDFSVTMSMKSFNSELHEQQFSIQSQRVFSLKNSQDFPSNSTSLKTQQNFEIQNYQDALEILKNYNNGFGSIMSKKDRTSLCDLQAKENIPSLGPNSNNLVENGEKKVRNGTMAKIRKMKKIENLDLETGYPVRQKRPFSVISQNQADFEGSHFQQSRFILEQAKKQAAATSKGSISSTRIKSRVYQQVVSLQLQIKHLLQTLAQINSHTESALAISKFKDSINTITYHGEYEYKGNCDHQQKPNGFGKLLWKGEIIYQGEWRGGKLHGWGKLVLLPFQKKQAKSIVSVDGNFRHGMVEGTVVCLFNSGQKFMGAIKKGKIEEEGTFVSEKGILTGHWQNNSLVFLI